MPHPTHIEALILPHASIEQAAEAMSAALAAANTIAPGPTSTYLPYTGTGAVHDADGRLTARRTGTTEHATLDVTGPLDRRAMLALAGELIGHAQNLPATGLDSDQTVIDHIASALAEPSWDAGLLSGIADKIGEVRPHPGDRGTRAAYARAFEAYTGRTLPGDNDDETLLPVGTCAGCRQEIDYVEGDGAWRNRAHRTYGCPIADWDEHEPTSHEARASALKTGDVYHDGNQWQQVNGRDDHGDTVLLTIDHGDETSLDTDFVITRAHAEQKWTAND